MTEDSQRGDRLWIIGAGRVGLSLGLALHRAGAVAGLAYTGPREAAPAHPLFDGDAPVARYLGTSKELPEGTTGIVIAVPDRVIPEIVAGIASSVSPEKLAGLPALHTSGGLGADVLEPLAALGASIGGVHPLAAVAHPVEGAERLRGASFGVEAEGPARALAERIVRACGGRVLSVAHGEKPTYHAAAVFASNYAVALLALAERLMERAGVPEEDARPALGALVAGAVANVAERGPVAALTGPVARGDDATVRLHLARLSGGERRLYSLLGREALALALRAGLDADAAERIADALGEGT
ncbi:MAG TPA: Rossmann-like and DUF2520 domain-containing protein [Longimicrobiaceae bacterium]|nr:Rossmann-like and DUF2520 domain-containing protein [Longimicrobiaceae bacterium]